MNSTMTLLKPVNNPILLFLYEQYYMHSLHREGKLIPLQSPEETNPLFKTAINTSSPRDVLKLRDLSHQPSGRRVCTPRFS